MNRASKFVIEQNPLESYVQKGFTHRKVFADGRFTLIHKNQLAAAKVHRNCTGER